MIEIDHIFIFSDKNGDEANQLIEAGFVEGSGNIHPGQGTRNRKFYFENFFLEILWVRNEIEFRSESVDQTGLTERGDFHNNSFSRFGLCLQNSAETDLLFKDAKSYQPDYFPEGMNIDILNNINYPGLPWTFRIPYDGKKVFQNEPKDHTIRIKKLTRASFCFIGEASRSFLEFFQGNTYLKFVESDKNELVLTFDENDQGQTIFFPDLFLQIQF